MKVLKISLLSLLISLFMISCSVKDMGLVPNEFSGAPAWVLTPVVEGSIASMGSAIPNAGNDFSYQIQEATADARDNMAQQLSVKVGNSFKSFKATTGSGEDSTFDRSSEKASRQIASGTLNGSKVVNKWISTSGNLYVLLVLDTESVMDAIEKNLKATNTSFKNKKAMYQKFLASKAQGQLEKDLEKFESEN